MTVLFVGAGNIGSALGALVAKNKHEVLFWDSDLKKVPHQGSLEEAVKRADIIFLCIPSWTVRECIASMKGFLKKTTPVICLAKGMEESTQKAIDEVLTEALAPHHPYGLFIGPMLAPEIIQGAPTAGLIASTDRFVYEVVKPLFKDTCLHVEYEPDVRGVALCSILKNIYAVGLGIAEALHFGSNGRGWYITLAFTEMKGIINRLGGKGESAHGLAGIGDLVATGLSPHSRNRTIGEQLVKTGICGKSEGCIALPSIKKHLGSSAQEFPLFGLLYRVIIEGENSGDAFGKFFRA